MWASSRTAGLAFIGSQPRTSGREAPLSLHEALFSLREASSAREPLRISLTEIWRPTRNAMEGPKTSPLVADQTFESAEGSFKSAVGARAGFRARIDNGISRVNRPAVLRALQRL